MVLRIRKEQLDAMAGEREKRFVARVVEHLRNDFPQQIAKLELRDEDLEPLVRRGLAEAQKHQVVNEGDVERYIECMVLLGPGFESDPKFPWAGKILSREDADGESKMNEINQHLMFGGIPGS